MYSRYMVVHFDFSFWFWEYVAIYCYLPHEHLHTFLERKQFKVGPFDRYKWSYDPYKWSKTHGYIPGVVILVIGIYRTCKPQNINTIVESMSQKPGSQADVMLKLKTPNTKSLVGKIMKNQLWQGPPAEVVKKLQELLHDLFFVIVFFSSLSFYRGLWLQ